MIVEYDDFMKAEIECFWALTLMAPQTPTDIAYVYSGYAPLSIRLAQTLARPGWRSITEVLNLLPGPKVEEVQQIPMGLRKRSKEITFCLFIYMCIETS